MQSKNGTWFEFPLNGQPAPQCMETLFSRDNHLGNGLGGFPNTFNWTIPNTPRENCVFRARYPEWFMLYVLLLYNILQVQHFYTGL